MKTIAKYMSTDHRACDEAFAIAEQAVLASNWNDAQMNTLVEQMASTVACHDAQGYGGLSETLLIVMQQHNLKEEQILYPIADNILSAQREALLDRMQAV